MRIGVFDSGFGGCTVLHALQEAFPQHSYVYLGDSANAPYGDKAPEHIAQLTGRGLQYLFEEQGCDWCVAACNTATIHGNLPAERTLGVVDATVREAARQAERSVLILATHATTASGMYHQRLHTLRPDLEIRSMAAPALVPMIEAGGWTEEEMASALEEYVGDFCGDTVVLGCTHYPLVLSQLRMLLGERKFIESGAAFCQQYREVFEGSGELSPTQTYVTTGDPFWFGQRIEELFGVPRLMSVIRHS